MSKYIRNFCYICGNRVQASSSKSWYCKTCEMTFYDSPRACAEVALFNDEGKVLLVKRAYEPWKGKFDLPGGFVEDDETAEQAMLRELQEELGLSKTEIRGSQYVTSWPCNYPWGQEAYSLLTTTFAAKLQPNAVPQPKDDVEDYIFVRVDDITPDMLSLVDCLTVMKEAEKLINKHP